MFRYIEDILLLILFFYIARKALGLFFSYLFKSAGGGQGGGGFAQSDPREGRKPEGKIEINFMPPAKAKKVADDSGEFIPYEEVKKDKP